jgi:N-acetyl sugar amidotransferase
MRICKECIQPDTRPGIYFDKNGVCGACLWEHQKNIINWKERESELEEIAEKSKKENANYDCAIGVSGGKDSTFQAITARDRLGLNCLLVNYQPENITNIGEKNIENLKNQGFDVVTVRPNPKIMKKLIEYDFFTNLNPIKPTEFSLYSSTYIIAEKFNIPLIIQGENPGLVLGTSLTGVGTDSNALKANEIQTLSSGWEIYSKIDGVNKKDLFWFHYNRKKLEMSGSKGIWLNYFIKEYSQKHNAEFSKKYGLVVREKSFDPNSIGTYNPHFQLDSDLTQVNQLLKFIKFGFGQCMDHVCYDIRNGEMTRKEAVELVFKYDGKCSDEYILEFCKYIDITYDEFWKTAEKFRGNMWLNNNGSLQNNIWKELEKITNN